MAPTDNATQAASDLTDALADYFGGASVLGVPANPGIIGGAPKVALLAAMAPGLNAPNGAAAAITAGWAQFWAVAGPLAPTIWVVPPNTVVPASLISPAGLASLATALQSTFDANVNAGLPLAAAALAIANAIHAASLGATVVLQPPLPAAPVVTPIL
jgi:hypothetical protein